MLFTILIILACIVVGLFITTFIIYFYNLDTKLLHALYKPMMNRLNNIERDRNL